MKRNFKRHNLKNKTNDSELVIEKLSTFQKVMKELDIKVNESSLIFKLYKKYNYVVFGLLGLLIVLMLSSIYTNLSSSNFESKKLDLNEFIKQENIQEIEKINPLLSSYLKNEVQVYKDYKSIIKKLDDKEKINSYIISRKNVLKDFVALHASVYYLEKGNLDDSNYFLSKVNNETLKPFKDEIFKYLTIELALKKGKKND